MNKSAKTAFVCDRTDKYFTKTKNIVKMFGEKVVTYAVFQRRPVIVATRLAEELIKEFCPEATVEVHHEEGTLVPPQTKVMTISGPFTKLVELETLWLQRLGVAQVCAYNAYKMSMALPHVPFLDMHGRHSTGDDMMIAAAYGASVGSRTARLNGAKGFIGTSNERALIALVVKMETEKYQIQPCRVILLVERSKKNPIEEDAYSLAHARLDSVLAFRGVERDTMARIGEYLQ